MTGWGSATSPTVDGEAVRDRSDRVRSLFVEAANSESLLQLRRIADESARYNLGDFRRTLNMPTVALSFMRQREMARYQFKRLKDETIGGRPARVLSYLEKLRPTIVQTPDGGDMPDLRPHLAGRRERDRACAPNCGSTAAAKRGR